MPRLQTLQKPPRQSLLWQKEARHQHGAHYWNGQRGRLLETETRKRQLKAWTKYAEARLKYAQETNDQAGIDHWSKEIETLNKMMEKHSATHDNSKIE